MTGDARNTSIWQGADVYIAPVGTPMPTDLTTAWGPDWTPVGLLDGAEGITETRDGDTSEKYAWGGILYRRTKSKHKRSFKFVALEDNDATFSLVNPGSTRTIAAGVRSDVIKVPETFQFAVGFELRDGDKTKRRAAKTAEVSDLDDVKEGEEDAAVYTITAVIFPESDGTLYRTISTDADGVSTPAV